MSRNTNYCEFPPKIPRNVAKYHILDDNVIRMYWFISFRVSYQKIPIDSICRYAFIECRRRTQRSCQNRMRVREIVANGTLVHTNEIRYWDWLQMCDANASAHNVGPTKSWAIPFVRYFRMCYRQTILGTLFAVSSTVWNHKKSWTIPC